ncbi:hypothetical protein RHSIM_Rhsim07G0205700 [Rhododendron simsii]|uniref:Protein FAR1-RELATED SEQUENCE n=1 Tax=Rhododendron simsii TaxID=118357 RepID=A0A834LF79_RHOSS|nr:hypothetical protein RHSIM_Rhsim07G0206800 [Rhododendron simsii]KAF7139300.1 hypothetical protein RHSIM_Rhsim07G0205700 [Rhododendron simsii]
MPGGPPKVIITDQDPAMAKAIASTLPNTHHKLCIWHMLNKFSQKLGALSYMQHYEEFRKCIWNSENPNEFETRWLDIVQKANLSSNEWLNDMYAIRERWIPAYRRHIFSAHMTSSQKSESDHAFFKRYVSKNNSLLEFVTRFDRALSHIRHNELDLDHKDVNEKPVLKTSWLMEKRMSELYTRSIFYKFQEEIHQKDAYVFTKTDEDEHRYLWNVQRAEMEGSRCRELSGCGKRLKGGKEKAVKALRKCHGCGLTGQSHDKRNCPKLLNMSSQDVRLNDEDDDEDGTDNE